MTNASFLRFLADSITVTEGDALTLRAIARELEAVRAPHWNDVREVAPAPGRRVLIWLSGAISGIWIGRRAEDSLFQFELESIRPDEGGYFVRCQYWRELPPPPELKI